MLVNQPLQGQTDQARVLCRHPIPSPSVDATDVYAQGIRKGLPSAIPALLAIGWVYLERL